MGKALPIILHGELRFATLPQIVFGIDEAERPFAIGCNLRVALEVGFDADLFRDRVHIEATRYDRRSTDALISIGLGTSTGITNLVTKNYGRVRNWGYEGLVNARLVDMKAVSFDLTLNGAIMNNQLVAANDTGFIPGPYGSGEYLKALEAIFGNTHDKLVLSEIENKDAIYDSIKLFLGKGK